MILIIFTIIFSFLVTFFLVPASQIIGIHYKLLDYPSSRKKHKEPIVRIGGLGIFISWLLTLLIIFFLNPFKLDFLIEKSSFSLMEIMISSFLFFIIGFADDIKRLSPYLRLFLQFGVASFCWGAGLSIDYLNLTLIFPNIEPYILPVFLSYLITIFFVVSVVNAVNWWDGLDGLSSGTSIISIFFLMIINLNFNNGNLSKDSLLMASLLGTLLGFLIYNYKPAKILMGDGGSYFIGFSLSYLTVLNNFSKNLDNLDQPQKIYLILPVLVVLPLLLDMVKVIIVRLFSSKLLFKPDRLHIHHNLLKMGLTEIQAVHQIYVFVLLVSSLSLYFLELQYSSSYFFICIFIFCLITIINFKKKFLN